VVVHVQVVKAVEGVYVHGEKIAFLFLSARDGFGIVRWAGIWKNSKRRGGSQAGSAVPRPGGRVFGYSIKITNK
jgi:hypothetical protein